ncbi:MAG: DEAD/DEAH box helicase [Pseudanabaena sp. Salubria-1]|jgi:superfamily II DNA/RNA helicase|nr:DEAD/DEAH box helicase [Pseudanabaena sp. Salubria-1]
MTYKLFEIPSESGSHTDIVWIDGMTQDAYAHLAYAIETTDSEDSVISRRGIRCKNLRDWHQIKGKFPVVWSRLKEKDTYYVGESVLEANYLNPNHHAQTVLRLGALELLTNIYSGRITASDKDPFPHQLALQQYLKNHESRIQRILIADEVGLGKTIEVGLILRDKLITQKDDLRCLYLTSGGLTEDVKEKLRSVIKVSAGDESIISVVDSFREYGDRISQKGIRIASMHAAKRYIDSGDKKDLPSHIKPNIIIIDECHHCSSDADLNGESPELAADTTQAYKAAYQMISGKFWQDSEPPELVILMSATPFRSANRFTNLLRLLAHKTALKDAYAKDVDQKRLLEEISKEDSPIALIWRQQDEIRNWSGKRLFPKLTIVRPHREDDPSLREGEPHLEKTCEEYLLTLRKIIRTVQRIHRDHGESLGGFASAHLETRLTSSSLAGACWLFRWCVRHHSKWQNEKAYKADNSASTEILRTLIREISKYLSVFDENRELEYAKEVVFPSDSNFSFSARNLADGSVPAIFSFQKKLLENVKPKKDKDDDDDDTDLEALPEEILELTELALNLLRSDSSVENAKLNWLKAMLEAHPDSRFLVFTEVLQTTTIITATFDKQSLALTGSMSTDERKEVVKKFYDRNKNYRILVATSAADEGLDFQVANKVVHWDLSPDPAVLMQRNGRVARLGQISDVTAYYLILEGTLAERRDTFLVDRLIEAGFTEPQMQLKILGQLDSKQQEKIRVAIETKDFNTVDESLRVAKQNGQAMKDVFSDLNAKLKLDSVLDRDDLLKRLKVWHDLGVTQYDSYKHKLAFETKEWQRPVFGEEKTEMESAVSDIMAITHSKNRKTRFNFDPEFALFSQEKNLNGLAGLMPWCVGERHIQENDQVIRQHQPLRESDPIGNLAQSLARQKQADFIAVSAQKLYESFPNLNGCSYLMFATHPLRELEKNRSSDSAKYLTYYTFVTDLSQPENPNGASANDVHKMITFLEEQAVQGGVSPSSEVIAHAKLAGRQVSEWVQNSFSLGGDEFLDEESSYFVPVPVALIAIVYDPDTAILGNEENEIQEKFHELADQWTQDVEGMSSTVEMVKHPVYQEIINMGQAVIPLMLKDLSHNPLYWLPALRQITQENPVQPEQRGKIKQMADAWLNWGKEKGYIV